MVRKIRVEKNVRRKHLKLRCRSPTVPRNMRRTIDVGFVVWAQDASLSACAMSFNACGLAAFSATAQPANIVIVSDAAPAGMPTTDASSVSRDILKFPAPRINSQLWDIGNIRLCAWG
jgi:hypothetical protein